MAKNANDLEWQKWSIIFTDKKWSKEDICRLMTLMNVELNEQLDWLIAKTISRKNSTKSTREMIRNSILHAHSDFQLPLVMLKAKWFEDYMKIIETTVYVVGVGIYLGFNRESLEELAALSFDFTIKKCTAHINNTINDLKSNVELALKLDQKTKINSSEVSHLEIISAIEIYQSLQRNDRYYRPYHPILILEFLRGCNSEFINQSVINALAKMVKV